MEKFEKSKIEKESVIELFRNGGLENSNAMELYRLWCDEQEKIVDSKSADIIEHRSAQVLFEISRSDIYMKGLNDIEGAKNALLFALYIAEQEELSDLVLVVQNKLEEIS